MPNSGDDASRKCFSGVLSRMLCSGSLPTHPSDQLMESSNEKLRGKGGHIIKQVVGVPPQPPPPPPPASPGVVARLMGLESFPTTPRDRTLGNYFRSKSVNSIDFLTYFDPIKYGDHQHRREGTSVSFHYQGVNDDFARVVLHESGENRGEFGEFLINEEKKRRKNREFFRDSRPGNLKKDFRGKTSVNLKERRLNIKAVISKEEIVGPNCVKMRKKKIHPEGTVPEIARSSRKQLRSRTAASRSPNTREDTIITRKNEREVKINENCYYKRMVEEICRSSEEDLKENWNYGREMKFEDFEGMIQEFGQEILEVLLNQFVDELVLHFGTMMG